MIELTQRLLHLSEGGPGDVNTACREAADMIIGLNGEIECLVAALKAFAIHATYPVAKEINSRGYKWRDEGALDYAKQLADAALGQSGAKE